MYLRNKWSDWNVHYFEGNELNKDGGQTLWKY